MNTPAQHHRWLDRWMGAGSTGTERLVEEGLALLRQHEQETAPRQRKRRPDDDRNHRTMVEAVVMNLAHAVLNPPQSGRLAVLTGKLRRPRTRYDHPAFGDTFPTVLTGLERIGWLTFYASPGMGEASAIEPSTRLAAKVCEAGITLSDFRRDAGETVILSRKDRHGAGADFTRELIDYPETASTTTLRGQMESVNAFLSGATLGFRDDGLEPVDLYQRQQRRLFTCGADEPLSGFDRGGRMFGGWWSNLNKHRRDHIRIEGEPVATLDYSSMFVRLAYAHLGIEPPAGDLYAIPGLIGHRRATKLIVNCLMFDEYHRHRWPQVTAPDETMPVGLTMPRVRAAILNHHPALAPCFGRGLGHRLMFTESTILMEVLLEMKARGIVGLGLHDGLMVPASRARKVEALMMEVSRWITSHTIPVTTDHPASASTRVTVSAPPYMRVVSSSRPLVACPHSVAQVRS